MTHDLPTEVEALDGDVLPHESCHDYSKGVFNILTIFTSECVRVREKRERECVCVCVCVCPIQH